MKFTDHLLVNYSVKKDCVNDNIHRIENILAELKAHPVNNVFYAVYQMGISSFFHVQCFPNEEITKEVFERPAFQQFFCQLESSIDQEPMANDIEKIGFYNSL
jgi:hypothetical protein